MTDNLSVVYRGGNNDVSLLGETDRGQYMAAGRVRPFAIRPIARCANRLPLTGIAMPWVGQ
jgi:hypothetical protein